MIDYNLSGNEENDFITASATDALSTVQTITNVLTLIVSAIGAISLVVGIPLIINPFSIIIAVGVSMLVGIIFGLYPARRAAHLLPIQALRYE